MNMVFTNRYLETSNRHNLKWGGSGFSLAILDMEVILRGQDINFINTFRLVLNKEDEALIISKAAMFCLEYLCDRSSTRRDARRHLRFSIVDRKYRKTWPWRWHQRRSCHGLARKIIVQKARLFYFFQYSLTTYGRFFCQHHFKNTSIYPPHSLPWIHWNFRNDDHGVKPFYQYRDFLEYLVIILPRAGRFSPLIRLCKTKAFVPMSMMFPDQSRKTRRAIAAYLDRMESDIFKNDTE